MAIRKILIRFYYNLASTALLRLSCRVLDSRPKGRGFEPHRRHCVVSLSNNINPSLVLVQPRKTRHFITERLLIRRKETNQTNKLRFYWVRCTINRSHSTPCKKAEFEHLQIFPGHCLDFFLSVSGKICHSPIKKVKRQPTLIISFSQHPPFFGKQSKNPG